LDVAVLAFLVEIGGYLDHVSFGCCYNDFFFAEDQVLDPEIEQFELKTGQVDAQKLVFQL
jgi:hypothetical protein